MNFRIVPLHKPFLFFIVSLVSFVAGAQKFPTKNYPKGYFIWPVDAKPGLAANFGELRPNHYHMGLDCKTDQKQNRPVYAAADGYVAHVRIEPGGFGRAIYINHPNGLTTLYGHLNDFTPEIEKYVKAQQYKLESWQVFLDIPPDALPVKQGQLIAYSGNTGASQGPHVHFEIRETKTDKVLNPLLFGFSQIQDNVPPSIFRLAVYDRNVSTYSQSPKLFSLKKAGGVLTTSPPTIIANSDKVSFGISAIDKYSGSGNPNGIYQAVLYYDDEAIQGFQIDKISYDETRYLNSHIDYKTRLGGGPFIEHLSRLPGYPVYPEGIYEDFNGDGVIEIEDDSAHQVRIEVEDTYGNKSTLQFQIKRGGMRTHPATSTEYEQKEFHPGYVNVFEREDLQVVLGEDDLYDSINFVYSKKASPTPNAISYLHSLHTGLVPVHGYYSVKIKPSIFAANINSDRIIMQRTWGGKTDVVKAKKEGEWFTGKFRYFGNMQLLVDNVPPNIVAAGIKEGANLSKASVIIFIVTDNNHDIQNFRAELDGKWLRFTNDKGRSFIYKFDEMCPPGEHELKVSVEDEAGNTATRSYHFSR